MQYCKYSEISFNTDLDMTKSCYGSIGMACATSKSESCYKGSIKQSNHRKMTMNFPEFSEKTNVPATYLLKI